MEKKTRRTERTYDRTKQRSHSPKTHRSTAILGFHDISDSATSDGDGCDTKHASNKAESDEHVHVGGQSASDGEDKIAQVTDMVDPHAAVKLAERCNHDGTKGKTENVASEHQYRCQKVVNDMLTR